MSKVKNLSLYEIMYTLKKVLAGYLVFTMLGGSPIVAKGEENKSLGNTDIKTEQLSSADSGVVDGALGEEVIEHTQHETRTLNSVEEFMSFRDSVLTKGWDIIMQSFPTKSGEYRNSISNGLVYELSKNSCTNIEKALENSGMFIQSYNSFPFRNYNATSGLFCHCFEQFLIKKKKNPKFELNLGDFILDDTDRENFERILAPLYNCAFTHKKKGSFDSNQLRELANGLIDIESELDESGDLQQIIYLGYVSLAANKYISENSKKWAKESAPSLDSKDVKEVASACLVVVKEIATNCYYTINEYSDYTIKKQNK